MSTLSEHPAYAADAGCYEAWRAAALAGVPTRTVYHWASTGLVVPSVSPVREMLWSYADLVALRVVAWLRSKKHTEDQIVPGSTMAEVRRALQMLDEEGINLWDGGPTGSRSPVHVDVAGKLYIETSGGFLNSHGQHVLELPKETLRLLAPFRVDDTAGPDLIAPAPHLRIVPLKVAGEPHIKGSRVTTRAVAALAKRGLKPDHIAAMYNLSKVGVTESIALERSFSRFEQAA